MKWLVGLAMPYYDGFLEKGGILWTTSTKLYSKYMKNHK